MELVVVVVVVELGCGWREHAREQGPGRVDEAGAGRPLMTTWYEYELRSLKFRMKMKTKMTQKMFVFAKSRVGFHFSKNDHFRTILNLIFEK